MRYLLTTILLLSLQPSLQAQEKALYSGSIMLSLAHGGMVDALMWAPDKKALPAFVQNDFTYLGGSVIVLSSNLFLARKWQPKHRRDFWFTTLGSMLVGSVFWDWTFSELRYNDPLYPLPNWYGGFGFPTKQDRIAFDAGRLLVGSLLIFLSDR